MVLGHSRDALRHPRDGFETPRCGWDVPGRGSPLPAARRGWWGEDPAPDWECLVPWQVSKTGKEIKEYIESMSGEDPLLKGIPEDKNPFKEKGGCTIS